MSMKEPGFEAAANVEAAKKAIDDLYDGPVRKAIETYSKEMLAAGLPVPDLRRAILEIAEKSLESEVKKHYGEKDGIAALKYAKGTDQG